LVGSKCDLVDEREVPIQDILKVSNDYGVKFIEISSKENKNVDDMFEQVVDQIFKCKKLNDSKNINNKQSGNCVVS
jgi:GTPase SAR1 family protein